MVSNLSLWSTLDRAIKKPCMCVHCCNKHSFNFVYIVFKYEVKDIVKWKSNFDQTIQLLSHVRFLKLLFNSTYSSHIFGCKWERKWWWWEKEFLLVGIQMRVSIILFINIKGIWQFKGHISSLVGWFDFSLGWVVSMKIDHLWLTWRPFSHVGTLQVWDKK